MSNMTNEPARGRGLVFPAAVLCLFFSASAGLIYQLVWTRYLGLLIGHTAYAIVAVLVTFIGGLALGNACLGRIADKLRRPLAFFALLQIIIGIYALAFPSIFEIAHGAYLAIATGAASGNITILLLQFVMPLALLLIPSVLMGGSLPVLTRMLSRSLCEVQNRVSTLYCINSLGAAVGIGAAEFWLIHGVGLELSIFFASAINLTMGVIALTISGYMREDAGATPADTELPDTAASSETFSPSEIRLAMIGIGISGLAAMMYGIAWMRLLALTMGSSSGAFAITLMTFILGIAIGSWLIARLKNLPKDMNCFAWMQIGIGASIILMMLMYSHLPYWFVRMASILERSEDSFATYLIMEGVFCFGVMIVPTIILGMTLPLVCRIATTNLADTGRSVGRVFGCNMGGALVGALITGLWILPTLGLARTFALGTGLSIAIGIIILSRNADPSRRKFVPMVLPGIGLWMLLSHSFFHQEWSKLTTSGAYRDVTAPTSFESFKQANNNTVLYHRDGAVSTVTVKSGGRSPDSRFLQVNGETVASSDADLPLQLLLAHVPALLHPNPQTALVIGLGSGATSGALLAHPTLHSVDTIEISPGVLAAAQYFNDINNGVLQNERSKIRIEDAKTYLATVDKQFDIIISQARAPWMADVPGLYSVEFFQQCAAHLTESGLMCQRLYLKETDDRTVETILATFTQAFPYTSIWTSDTDNLLLIGGTHPYVPDLNKLLSRFSDPQIRASLARARISRPATLLALQLISEDYTVHAFPVTSEIHSDYYPALERLAQLGHFTGRKATEIFDLDERKTLRANTLLTHYSKEHPFVRNDWIEIIDHNTIDTILDDALVRSICAAWAKLVPGDPSPHMIAAEYDDERSPPTSDVALMAFHLKRIVDTPQHSVRWSTHFAYSAMGSHRYLRSAFHTPSSETLVAIMEQLAETFPKEAHIYNTYLAELAWDTGDMDRFHELAGEIFIRMGPTLSLSSFPKGESSPAIVLTRLIEHYLDHPDPVRLERVIQVAERVGFASDDQPRLRAAIARAKQ